MSAVINQTAPVTPVAAAAQATPQLVLQPGAVIDARVVAVRENLARILIAGLSLDVLTEVALQPGANLKLAVSQTADGVVRLAVVPQGTPGGQQGQAAAQAPSGGPATVVTNSAAASAAATSQTVGTAAQTQLPRVASASLAPATPEAIAISQAVQSAAPRQRSLAPLFANLPVIVASPDVPPQVQGAASKLLATRPPLDATLTADDLRQAFQKSGLFLEATLAKGAAPSGTPDLKAALVVFRQVVSNWLGHATAPALPTPQAPAASQPLASGLPPTAQQPVATPTTAPATLPLAPGLVPEPGSPIPLVAGSQILPPTAQGAGEPQSHAPASVPVPTAVHELPELSSDVVRTAVQAFVRDAVASFVKTDNPPTEASNAKPVVHPQNPPPAPRQTAEAAPPFRGALPAPQPVAAPSLSPDAPAAGMGQKLLEQTDAALARQTLLQVASLPDRPELAGTSQNNQASQQRWSFEIPFATPQGTAMAQFEISRDGGNEAEAAAPTRVWRARFTLDVEPTGPVHALVSLIGEKTAVRMWAERPETAAQLRANADALSQALRRAELEPGDILVGEGAPPQPKARAGRFLDRAT